jgi:hypothetical protein
MVMVKVTRTSPDRGWTCPAEVEVFSRLIQTSPDMGRTSPDKAIG